MWNRRSGKGKHVYRKVFSIIRQKPSLGEVKQERGRELWLARLNRGMVHRAMLFFSYIDINWKFDGITDKIKCLLKGEKQLWHQGASLAPSLSLGVLLLNTLSQNSNIRKTTPHSHLNPDKD